MPVPKKRTSHSKRNMRRSHHFLAPIFTSLCSFCSEPKLRHRACPSCGKYKGRQVLNESKTTQTA